MKERIKDTYNIPETIQLLYDNNILLSYCKNRKTFDNLILRRRILVRMLVRNMGELKDE